MSTAGQLQEEIQDKTWGALLSGKVSEELLLLSDPNGDYYWDKVEEKNIKYFVRQCAGHPWANHFALALICLSDLIPYKKQWNKLTDQVECVRIALI